MGGFCTQSTTTLPDPKSVLSGTQIPEWVSSAGRQLYEQSAEMAASPFPTYTGQRIATYGNVLDDQGNPIEIPQPPIVAPETDLPDGVIGKQPAVPRLDTSIDLDDWIAKIPDDSDPALLPVSPEVIQPQYVQSKLTPEEIEAGRLLSEGKDVYQPYIDDATAIAGQLGSGYGGASREDLLGERFTAETAQPYVDIFQRSVDPAIAEINRQTQRNLAQEAANAAKVGAFGGSRQGLREAETMSEGTRLASDLRAQAGASGLEFAGQRFDQERAARMAAEDAMRAGYETDEASRLRATETLQGFAPLVQGLQEQAASGLLTTGEARRKLDQAALDLAYGDYVEQREYPFQMANFALGALQGVPYETRTIGLEQGQQFVQNPSVYGQTIGGLGSLASAYYLGNRRT
mgnify:CR=1 FL=1